MKKRPENCSSTVKQDSRHTNIHAGFNSRWSCPKQPPVKSNVSNFARTNPGLSLLSELFKDLVWPDFKVGTEGLWVVFRRVEERYFPRKSKDESSQLNDESSMQE